MNVRLFCLFVGGDISILLSKQRQKYNYTILNKLNPSDEFYNFRGIIDSKDLLFQQYKNWFYINILVGFQLQVDLELFYENLSLENDGN